MPQRRNRLTSMTFNDSRLQGWGRQCCSVYAYGFDANGPGASRPRPSPIYLSNLTNLPDCFQAATRPYSSNWQTTWPSQLRGSNNPANCNPDRCTAAPPPANHVH